VLRQFTAERACATKQRRTLPRAGGGGRNGALLRFTLATLEHAFPSRKRPRISAVSPWRQMASDATLWWWMARKGLFRQVRWRQDRLATASSALGDVHTCLCDGDRDRWRQAFNARCVWVNRGACAFLQVGHSVLLRDFAAALARFSATRKRTIRSIKSSGNGWSMGNCTEPFAPSYPANSSLNASVPLEVG
jgi:hypothetical protein